MFQTLCCSGAVTLILTGWSLDLSKKRLKVMVSKNKHYNDTSIHDI